MFATLFAQAERLPNVPDPQLPKLPDLAGVEGVLTKLKGIADHFEASLTHVNSSLLITGLWIGAVTMGIIWFVSTRYRKQ